MSWNPEHKQATRERIVSAAAGEFRKRGLEAVGVADVMAKAGLTHGGFYAHFKSKEDLVAESLRHALAQSALRKTLDEPQGDAPPPKLSDVAAGYLSSSHAQRPEAGCPLAALGEEWSRAKGPVRKVLDQAITHRLDSMARRAPGASAAARRSQAAGTLAAMVGGIVLARGLDDEAAARFLADVRAYVAGALEE